VFEIGDEIPLSIELGLATVTLRAVVRREIPGADGGTELGVEFAAGQQAALARLAVALLASEFSAEEVSDVTSEPQSRRGGLLARAGLPLFARTL
jgi:hypothetical protein